MNFYAALKILRMNMSKLAIALAMYVSAYSY